jgi:hypothetical protein
MMRRLAGAFFILCLPAYAFAADKIVCEQKSAFAQGRHGEEVRVRISTTATPDLIPPGAFPLAASGSCTFEHMGGSDPDIHRYERYTRDDEGVGFECYVRPNAHVFYKVILKLWVCKAAGADGR